MANYTDCVASLEVKKVKASRPSSTEFSEDWLKVDSPKAKVARTEDYSNKAEEEEEVAGKTQVLVEPLEAKFNKLI